MSALTNWTNSGRGNVALYLPMKDADSAGVNEAGTGDFTVNGVLDTVQRGANQYNCVASKFDGAADYLSKSLLDGTPLNNSEITISLVFKANFSTAFYVFIGAGSSFSGSINMTYNPNTDGIRLYDQLLNFDVTIKDDLLKEGTESGLMHLVLSFDLSDITKRNVLINNRQPSSVIWDSYINYNILWDSSTWTIGRRSDSNHYYTGSMGEMYVDNSYIDLETDNPFWDSVANKPKPVRQVLEETGNTPLIAMPISADNPTLNLGTGGDFTLNGGGLVGARGASEFWARSADSNLTNQGGTTYTRYLQAPSPFSDSVTELTIVIAAKTFDSSAVNYPCMMSLVDGLGNDLFIKSDVGEDFAVNGVESGAYVKEDDVFTVDNIWHFYAVTFKSGETPSWRLFNLKNRTQPDTGTSQGPYDYSSASGTMVNILSGGDGANSGDDWAGAVSSIYAIEQYIDLTQEENRNLFCDQLGYPKDLKKQIEEGLIPTPLIYLPFDDPNDLGKNLGTGDDFTITGNITPGSDFTL